MEQEVEGTEDPGREVLTIEQTTTCGFCGRTVSAANKAEWRNHVAACSEHPAHKWFTALVRAHNELRRCLVDSERYAAREAIMKAFEILDEATGRTL